MKKSRKTLKRSKSRGGGKPIVRGKVCKRFKKAVSDGQVLPLMLRYFQEKQEVSKVEAIKSLTISERSIHYATKELERLGMVERLGGRLHCFRERAVFRITGRGMLGFDGRGC